MAVTSFRRPAGDSGGSKRVRSVCALSSNCRVTPISAVGLLLRAAPNCGQMW